MKIVVDTSVLIDHLRGGSYLTALLKSVDNKTSFFISSIVIFELFSGKSTENKDAAAKVYRLISSFEIIEVTPSIATRAGELYRDVDNSLDFPDYIIAATALEIGADIATLNKKHFRRINGLRLVD